MSAPNAHISTADQSQRYAAAESLLQHSRLSRNESQNINGFLIPGAQPAFRNFQAQPQGHLPAVPVSPYSDFSQSYQSTVRDQVHGYDESVDAPLSSPQEAIESPALHIPDPYSERARVPVSMAASQGHQTTIDHVAQPSYGENNGNGSRDESETTSPTSSRDLAALGPNGLGSSGIKIKQDEDAGGLEEKNELDRPPAWSELKTKAGKERKRLPLACIACRRKKIRCSGEKPACKHCLRSRIPCVYKVTARKAAPRTDYMAMLDKRLKRMEERVIKIIPKEEMGQAATIGRANVRPSGMGQDGKVQGGKKRAAGEAFGPDLDEWVHSKTNNIPLKELGRDDKARLTEGAESLPSKEIQEHLSEIIRAGTVPPVLILAVCAISARFSTHPQVNSEPAFLRGEDWAAPAREIALRRYDEPNITTLTVFLILGLHEFGTCQGGRSWMFGGMAMRMAYALQLHRESDHDPLGQKSDKKSVLSFTDREIRRRTMWACFLMDRFNSSGTERPTCANEENIEVQLPIKESHFLMEIPGPTESLGGDVSNPMSSDAEELSNPKDNMGVASYMIRIIALWGRVIKYLNMGGKERDAHPIWNPESEFAKLKRQAEVFQTSLPSSLQNNQDNLKNHAAEKLANQFLFMHIASYQVILFLHCFAIPTSPGEKLHNDLPKAFVAEAGSAAIEAAAQISLLLKDALDYLVVAPFAGYCAFTSSTVQVWGIFSKNPSLEATSKQNLARNVKYLSKMKRYWGMFHFMGHNLKDIYRQHAEASHKGLKGGETSKQDQGIFQYGDWFQKYPHGVSKTDYEDPTTEIKKELSNEAVLSQKSDLRSVEEFFSSLAPPAYAAPNRKPPKKTAKKLSHTTPSLSLQPDTKRHPPQPAPHPPLQTHPPLLPLQLSTPHPSLPPTPFSPQPNQLLFPSAPGPPNFQPTYDLLPQLDRHLVYGAHAGSDPTASSSSSAMNALSTHDPTSNAASEAPQVSTSDLGGGLSWDASVALGGSDFQQQQQQQQAAMQAASQGAPYLGMSDLHTGAWFMPFNLNPPEIVTEGDDFGRGPFGGFGAGDGMGGV
ncbi:hypothetical protein MMC07_003733 [Pseudocyphellaria aurata]|nr:hypothetical protein [Pseudocyphellaria aurata]